jgi:hypothetical protein
MTKIHFKFEKLASFVELAGPSLGDGVRKRITAKFLKDVLPD